MGSVSDAMTSILGRFSDYPPRTEKIIVFDKHQDISDHESDKDHERQRWVGDIIRDYELAIASPLPKRDTVLKSKSIKSIMKI